MNAHCCESGQVALRLSFFIQRGGTTDVASQFDGLADEARKLVAVYELQLRARPLQGFQQYVPPKSQGSKTLHPVNRRDLLP